MFDEKYEELRNSEKEEFASSVNTLMLKSFLTREYYDKNAKMMRASKEYSFVDRNFDLVEEYLSYTGWVISKDSRHGVIAIENEYKDNHIKMDLLTSLIVYTLRYIYENQKDEDALSQEVASSSVNVLSTLMDMHLIKADRRPSFVAMGNSFRFLEQHNIISRISGDFKERNLQFYILPSIIFVIDNEMINSIFETIEDIAE